RGMKELDVVLSAYLESAFINAPEQEKQAFRSLLEMPDPDLFSLLVGRTETPDTAISIVVSKLKKTIRR
ncbi:MAG: succinate dehydrogenase assembly factor 2, partial [Psychromonas sp.]|nr:succinate dehydrogenase assembly factor 2 [Psychromonas sp.]